MRCCFRGQGRPESPVPEDALTRLHADSCSLAIPGSSSSSTAMNAVTRHVKLEVPGCSTPEFYCEPNNMGKLHRGNSECGTRSTKDVDEENTPASPTDKSGISFDIPTAPVPGVVQPCLDHFEQLKVIGKGGFGEVVMARHKESSEICAIKILNKAQLVDRNQVAHLKAERQVLEKVVGRPFLVDFFYAFQTKQHLYLVMEFCHGGELFFHLQRSGRFQESTARFYSSELTIALGHLHSLDIIYRDLKPENVLLDGQGHIKLTDFGLARIGASRFDCKSVCGTLEYLAPEIVLRRGHNKAADWYTLGALIYEMLNGKSPFHQRSCDRNVFARILNDNVVFPVPISPAAKSICKALLVKDPNRRLNSMECVQKHPFYAKVDWEDVLAHQVTPPFVPEIDKPDDVKYFSTEFTKLPLFATEFTENIPEAANLPHFANFDFESPRFKKSVHSPTGVQFFQK